MSSTLSEGVRVPDIGSVNWGADVNFNWGLLNTALANISGNVKVNVANTWTAPQTFTETISGSIDGVAARAVGDEDGTNIKTALASKAADSAVVHLAGAETITGDKTWTAINTFSGGQLKLKSSGQEIGVTPTNSTMQYFEFNDKNNEQHGVICLWDYNNGASEIQMNITDKFKNGAKDPTGTSESTFLSFGFKTDGNRFLTFSGQLQNSLIPNTNNTYDLGTSTNKWKTFNGINPGALSLPSSSTSAYININSSIPDLTGTTGTYVPTANGWIHLNINPNSSNYAYASATWLVARASSEATTGRNAMVTIPVLAGVAVTLSAVGGSIAQARFTPCQGNV